MYDLIQSSPVNSNSLIDTEKEASLIIAFKRDSDSHFAIDKLSPDDFSYPLHQNIFVACQALYGEGQQITFENIVTHLEEKHNPIHVHVHKYLKEIEGDIPLSLQVENDVNILKNLAIKRSLLQENDPTKIPSKILQFFRHSVSTLQTSSKDLWTKAREIFPRESFPWEVFPCSISCSLQQLARSCATSPLSLPGTALAIFASTIGGTIKVSPKASWKEPLIIWTADIRESGEGKTPSANILCEPLYRAQRQADNEEKRLKSEEMKKKPRDRSPVPRAKSYFITDPTLEGISAESEYNAHGGTIYISSELSSFISGQNQYKKRGSDREGWLKLHDGNPARIVRKSGSITINNMDVSISGGIQPRVWKEYFGAKNNLYIDDGTIFRFMPTFEGSKFYPRTSEEWEIKNRLAWEDTIKNALKWSELIASRDNWTPKIIALDEEAQCLFYDWANRLNCLKNDIPVQLKGYIPKIVGYALRFAGILHCIDCFSKKTCPKDSLSLQDIQKGIEVVQFYLGQIVDAIHVLCSKDIVKPTIDIDETGILIAQTLIALKDEVYSGRLPIDIIRNKYNESQNIKISSSRIMGNILRNYGLDIPKHAYRYKNKSGVTCLLWDDKVESLLNKIPQPLNIPVNTSDVENVEIENNISTSERPVNTGDVENVENVEKKIDQTKNFDSAISSNFNSLSKPISTSQHSQQSSLIKPLDDVEMVLHSQHSQHSQHFISEEDDVMICTRVHTKFIEEPESIN